MADTVESLLKRLDVMNAEVSRLENTNLKIMAENQTLKAEKAQWQTDKVVQSSIIAQRVMEADQEKKVLSDEIIELQAELKRCCPEP